MSRLQTKIEEAQKNIASAVLPESRAFNEGVLYGLKQASSLDAPAARSMKVVLTDVELDVLSEAIHRAFQAPCDSYGAEILEAVEAKVKAALQVIAEGRH